MIGWWDRGKYLPHEPWWTSYHILWAGAPVLYLIVLAALTLLHWVLA